MNQIRQPLEHHFFIFTPIILIIGMFYWALLEMLTWRKLRHNMERATRRRGSPGPTGRPRRLALRPSISPPPDPPMPLNSF